MGYTTLYLLTVYREVTTADIDDDELFECRNGNRRCQMPSRVKLAMRVDATRKLALSVDDLGDEHQEIYGVLRLDPNGRGGRSGPNGAALLWSVGLGVPANGA